jgi:tetratricopeptide (TPR) repeat protein
MYFDNLADPEDKEKLGEIATSLLVTDLSESQYIKVLSSQRLYDILKLLGREGEKRLDRDVASEVADKAGVRWMLLGSILQVEPHIEMASNLVNVSSGQVEASQRVVGEPGETIFSLVDKLTVEVKRDLSLPEGAESELDPGVADVTTDSPEAYRYYLEGLEYDSRFYNEEAARSFRKALEFDSTFAMAYYRLWWSTSGAESEGLLAKAVKHSKKASRRERAYIKAGVAFETKDTEEEIKQYKKIANEYPEEKEAFYLLGNIYRSRLRDPEEAIRYYTRAIEIDPLYKLAYNSLAYAYNEIGDLDKSIWAINQYISIAPDEANPYDTRGDLYAWNGKLDEAIASYEKVLEIKPDFKATFQKLGNMYLLSREYEKAEKYFRKLVSDKNVYNRAWGRGCLGRIPAYRGKFGVALEVLDAGISADLIDQVDEPPYIQAKRSLKANIHGQGKEWELALQEARVCMEISRPDDPAIYLFLWRARYGRILALSGKIEEAEEVARVMKKDIEREDPTIIYQYWALSGVIELEKGNAGAAVGLLEKAQEKHGQRHGHPEFDYRFFLAQAYLELGRLDAAVSELEGALQRCDGSRANLPILAVKSFYVLGLAYERSGWTAKAIEQYEEFLDIWKDADPGIEELEDAKARLARLKGAA